MTLSEQLEQLDELHRRGVLTDEEFGKAKARTLAQGGGTPGMAALNGLQRSDSDRWLGGVCGGLAQSLGVASWVLRLGFILLLLCAGTGVLLYALLWFFLPLGTGPARLGDDSGTLHAG
jgi:phage shock protein PspC (stress-responsive transcriptional regulator)